jgi:hypothetical protein
MSGISTCLHHAAHYQLSFIPFGQVHKQTHSSWPSFLDKLHAAGKGAAQLSKHPTSTTVLQSNLHPLHGAPRLARRVCGE